MVVKDDTISIIKQIVNRVLVSKFLIQAEYIMTPIIEKTEPMM